MWAKEVQRRRKSGGRKQSGGEYPCEFSPILKERGGKKEKERVAHFGSICEILDSEIERGMPMFIIVAAESSEKLTFTFSPRQGLTPSLAV